MTIAASIHALAFALAAAGVVANAPAAAPVAAPAAPARIERQQPPCSECHRRDCGAGPVHAPALRLPADCTRLRVHARQERERVPDSRQERADPFYV